jgi:hypothetical protein
MNQVERWFGVLTDKLIRRSVHQSVEALEADIRAWIETYNEDPPPFVWTKTAHKILASLANYCPVIPLLSLAVVGDQLFDVGLDELDLG